MGSVSVRLDGLRKQMQLEVKVGEKCEAEYLFTKQRVDNVKDMYNMHKMLKGREEKGFRGGST